MTFIELLQNTANIDTTKQRLHFINSIMKNLLIIYFIFLISKVYFPINISLENQEFSYPVIWLKPLTSLINVYKTNSLYGFTYQIIGNLLLLSPLAFFAMYFKNEKYNTLRNVVFLCLKVSIFIEFSQIFLSLSIPSVKRYFEINDLILNSTGAIIGYFLYIIFDKISQIKIHQT